MDLSFSTIFAKLMLGVALAAPIGPVSVEMIKRGLRHGFLSAFSVRLGGAVGNTLCLVVTYYGLSHILSHPNLLNALGLIGAALLIYMGVKTVLKGIKDLNLEAPVNVKNALSWGFYLAVANPVAFVFWPGLFAASIDPEIGITFSGLILNLFIIAGVILWGAGLSLVLAIGHRNFNKQIIVLLSRLAGLLMIYYGLSYSFDVLTRI